MSHFCGIVFVEAESDAQARHDASIAVSPYDESLEVDTYVYRTREELINEIKQDAASEQQFIDANKSSEDEFVLERIMRIQNKLLTYNNFKTDSDCLEYAETLYNLDEEGNELTTYNPDSKWDWYQVGGRWDGDVLHAGEYGTNCAPKESLTKIDTPYCFIDLNGAWHEKGSMGWFGVSYDEKDTWEEEFREYLKSVPENTWLVLIDFHI